MTTDSKISQLSRGHSMVLSSIGGVTVRAERSGDGKTLRIVRETANGFAVIKTTRF